MPEPGKDLGKLISTFGTAPVYLQRAAIIGVLSFLFFVVMLIGFSIRHHIGYFVLSSAFLVVYILTMVSWVLQKRNIVRIFENGLRYKKFGGTWNEITAHIIDERKANRRIELSKIGQKSVLIRSSINGFDRIASVLEQNTHRQPAVK